MSSVPQAEHIRFLFDPGATLGAFAGQRRRLAATVAGLSPDEMAVPSRCEGWTVGDVVRHLVWVDLTVRRLWSGDQSVADGFDPRTTPDEAVRRDRAVPDEEVRERYLVSTETMVADFESSGPQRYGRPSLSPAGPVPWWMSAVHVGWDSSVHERDVLIPLGRVVDPVVGETTPCLAYSLVLTSFFAGGDPLAVGLGGVHLRRDAGPVIVEAAPASADGDGAERGAATVLETDDPVEVVDAIAGRNPVEGALRGDPGLVHRLGGLARYFTSASP